MTKRDLRAGMRSSMKLEEDATNARFERAETVFASPTPPQAPPAASEQGNVRRKPVTKAPIKYVLQTFSISKREIDLLDQLKAIAAEESFAHQDPIAQQAALGTNKSELVRIAIQLLASQSSSALLDLIVKTKSQSNPDSKQRPTSAKS